MGMTGGGGGELTRQEFFGRFLGLPFLLFCPRGFDLTSSVTIRSPVLYIRPIACLHSLPFIPLKQSQKYCPPFRSTSQQEDLIFKKSSNDGAKEASFLRAILFFADSFKLSVSLVLELGIAQIASTSDSRVVFPSVFIPR